MIISPTSNWSAYRPYWSPTSSHIAFTGQTRSGSPPNYIYNLDVNRATATGGNLTDLTNQPAPFNEYINIHSAGEDGGESWRERNRQCNAGRKTSNMRHLTWSSSIRTQFWVFPRTPQPGQYASASSSLGVSRELHLALFPQGQSRPGLASQN